MNDLEHALSAYENALRHNPMSMSGLTQVACIARIKENYPKVRVYLLFTPCCCDATCDGLQCLTPVCRELSFFLFFLLFRDLRDRALFCGSEIWPRAYDSISGCRIFPARLGY